MEATPSIRARPMSELIPELSDGILSKECMRFLTAKKTRQELIPTRNVRSAMKPLTLAEMRTEILALQVVQSPKRGSQVNRSARKKAWNSSVKVDKKTISHTDNKQLKNKPVRKVLDFQAPAVLKNSKPTGNFESVPQSTKFRKPESRLTKSIALQARHDPRISGICKISETPVVMKSIKNRMTIANKENFPSIKKPSVPKALPSNNIIQKNVVFAKTVTDTPMSNDSWKSSGDASFLQAEKEINDIEEKTKALAEERTLDKLDDITPPASTPFIENRNIKKFFNPTSDVNTSVVEHDDTIMNFDNSVKDSNREDSVIVSLCSLLNKATMKSPKNNSELDYLLHIEKLIEEDTNTIDNTIDTLHKMKQSHLQALKTIKKMLEEKKSSKKDMDRTLVETKESINKIENPKRLFSEKGTKVKSVIVSPRSPSYKIPKKSISLQKKVVCKSMPNIANNMITPVKGDMGVRALSMYMKMKQHMNFLNTPVTKRTVTVMDTPAVTSHNLQNQLDKLYDED